MLFVVTAIFFTKNLNFYLFFVDFTSCIPFPLFSCSLPPQIKIEKKKNKTKRDLPSQNKGLKEKPKNRPSKEKNLIMEAVV